MIRGIIIGHGEFARAVFDTAEKIVGKQKLVEVISNAELSCEMLCEKIKEVIHKYEGEQLIFVDLPGGSCTISCLSLMKTNRHLKIISGVNLPMLIEFFILREKYSTEEIVPILIKKGRDNIFKLGAEAE